MIRGVPSWVEINVGTRAVMETPRRLFFFFTDTPTTEIYTLSLHDALPIYLDQKLMQAMQLMRLLRERVSVDLAKKAEIINPSRPSASSTESVAQAVLVLADPAQRADPAKRAAAREAFRAQRTVAPEIYYLSTAAMVFLGRSDADWRLQGAVLKALQEYFAKPWLKEALKLTPERHLEAASWLASQIVALRKADAAAP